MIPSIDSIRAVGFVTLKQAVAIRHAMYQHMHSIPSESGMDVMHRINEIIGAEGVEYIPQGKNKRSPAITYVNMGDTYNTTVLLVNGRFRIGAWGDIVERGNYE